MSNAKVGKGIWAMAIGCILVGILWNIGIVWAKGSEGRDKGQDLLNRAWIDVVMHSEYSGPQSFAEEGMEHRTKSAGSNRRHVVSRAAACRFDSSKGLVRFYWQPTR